jgi:hypothetical protein
MSFMFEVYYAMSADPVREARIAAEGAAMVGAWIS